MFPVKNDITSINIFVQAHAKVFQYIAEEGEKFLKRIFCFTKFNEINIGHSDVQKHVSYTWSYKAF